MDHFNVRNMPANGRAYPTWGTRVRILEVDAEGNVREDAFAFNGELFQRSPRFLRNGHTYRLRPERPLAVLAALAFKHKMLPALLTAEEAASDWGRELIVPLWPQLSRCFQHLASPLAESDTTVQPGPVVGWSFKELQVLCREVGSSNGTAPAGSQPTSPFAVNADAFEAARKTIEAMRARAATPPTQPTPAKPKKS